MKLEAVPCETSWRPAPVRPLQWAVLALIIVVGATPFLNKAFHLDDVLYLRGADQILHTPFDPYGGKSNAVVLWDAPDGQPYSLFKTDLNPPLWKYLLAATIANFGREEWKLHLLESLFVALAAIGIFQFARRLCPWPNWCVAMILLSPFFWPGQNIMLEGPLLCFWIWSLEFAVRAWMQDSVRWSLLAGFFAGLAVLTKYTAGLLLILLFVGAILHRRPRTLFALLPPTLMLGLWMCHNIVYHGQPHLGAHGLAFVGEPFLQRAFVLIRVVGAICVFGPICIYLLWRFPGGKRAAIMVSIAGLIWGGLDAWQCDLSSIRTQNYHLTLLMSVHVYFFAANGAWIVLGLAVFALEWLRRWERSTWTRPVGSLSVWMLLVIAFNLFSTPFTAVRHLLMFCVPLTFWLAHRLGELPDSRRIRKTLVLASASLGAMLACADYDLANAYRDEATVRVGELTRSGRTVWFTGTWGFMYYASQAGAHPLLRDPRAHGLPPVRPGDFVVYSNLLTWRSFPPDGFPPVRLFEHWLPAARQPFRTLSFSVNYYFIPSYGLPWLFLLELPDPADKEALFVLPPLDDLLIYEVQ